MELKTFHVSFQISKMVIFNASYDRLGNNKNKYFATSANLFNRPKTDFNQGGQAQESLLPKHSPAYIFYKKWDVLHLKDLTESQYNEMLLDINELKSIYNYIEKDFGEGFGFSVIKELSKMEIKR